MIICSCKAVTDREIRAAAESGRARTPSQVARECGAGDGCGGCLETIRTILDECGVAPPPASVTVLFPNAGVAAAG